MRKILLYILVSCFSLPVFGQFKIGVPRKSRITEQVTAPSGPQAGDRWHVQGTDSVKVWNEITGQWEFDAIRQNFFIDSLQQLSNTRVGDTYQLKGLDVKYDIVASTSLPVDGIGVYQEGVNFAVVQGDEFPVRLYGLVPNSTAEAIDNKAKYQAATDFGSASKKTLLWDDKYYIGSDLAAGPAPALRDRFIIDLTGNNFNKGTLKDRGAEIVFLPPSGVQITTATTNGPWMCAYRMENPTSAYNNMSFENMTISVNRDSFWTHDSLINNVSVFIMDNGPSGSDPQLVEPNNSLIFKDFTLKRFYTEYTAATGRFTDNILQDNCTFEEIAAHWANGGENGNKTLYTTTILNNADSLYTFAEAMSAVALYFFDNGEVIERQSSLTVVLDSTIAAFRSLSGAIVEWKVKDLNIDSVVITGLSSANNTSEPFDQVVGGSGLTFRPFRKLTIMNSEWINGMFNPGSHAIYTSGSPSEDLTLINNKLIQNDIRTGNRGGGFHIRGGSVDGVKIIGNEIANNSSGDISLGVVDNAIISANRHFRTLQHPNPSSQDHFVTISSSTKNANITANIYDNQLLHDNVTLVNTAASASGANYSFIANEAKGVIPRQYRQCLGQDTGKYN